MPVKKRATKKRATRAKIGGIASYVKKIFSSPTVKKAAAALEKMKKEASFTDAYDSKYRARLESLEKFDVE